MLTFAEVCVRLRVSPKTLRKIIQSGDLKATRVGRNGAGGNGAYRIEEDDLADYLRRQAVEVPA
jgi:excisionase family DNA binding protein